MKKLLLAVLCLALLCGCAKDEPAPTVTTAEPATTPAPTTPPPPTQTLYLPDSEMEQLSGGALRLYECEESVLRMEKMGADLLVATLSPEGRVRLRRVSGENGLVVWERLLETGASYGTGMRVSDKGVCYYNALEHMAVVLDENLQEIERVSLPQQITLEPVASQDLTTLYYCVEDEIRVLNLDTGVSRMLKQHSCQWQKLEGLVNEDAILLCRMAEDGRERTVFISTEDGRTLGADDALLEFMDGGRNYMLLRQDGPVVEMLFGSFEGALGSLNLPDKTSFAQYIPGSNSVITLENQEEGRVLTLYSLNTGVAYSRICLSPEQEPVSFVADGERLWFVVRQGENQTLCRWDTPATALVEETSYISQRYTSDSPDTQGLARCRELANQMEEKYGVKLLLLPEEVEQPEGYSVVAEYQVEALEKALADLDRAMSRFPEGFFRQIVEQTTRKELEISLVRSISGEETGIQFWRKADPFIVLATGDTLEQSAYHQIWHVTENFVLANTRDLDFWESRNPKGFSYDNSYSLYTQHGSEYLEGQKRAFINAYSRSYAREDRATFFEYAMMGGNQDCFASETMQKKLYVLCYAIRDGFDWNRKEYSFPWEQYLEESLVYVKKK